MLFIHIFFIWWVLSRSGKLLDGISGHFLPLDAFNALLRIPFRNFLIRIKTLVFSLRNLGGKNGKGQKWIILAIFPCIALLAAAVSLLMKADDRFASVIHNIVGFFTVELDLNTVVWLLFSLPVGAWLYGLIGGSSKLSYSEIDRQRESAYSLLRRLKRIPAVFWIIIISVFSAIYLLFFFMQGSYLFGAFTRTLPEGFNVAQYARQGFFELCKVMAVNFCVLWLVTRMSADNSKMKKYLSAACIVMLFESILFAVIALSKLVLYISCFGFTPLRLQSTWLVCVLLAGCILWISNIISNCSVFRKWMFFGAGTLTFLTLI